MGSAGAGISSPLFRRLQVDLGEFGVHLEHLQHEPASSTEDLARLRGMPLDAGCKALLMKANRDMVLVALRSSRAIDNHRLRQQLGVRRLRFATPAELLQLTGLVPGQVPPFGQPWLPFPLVADRSVLDSDTFTFTAGTHTDSLTIRVDDWLRLARPRLLDFSQPSSSSSPR